MQGAGCNDAREGERNWMQEDGGRGGGGRLSEKMSRTATWGIL